MTPKDTLLLDTKDWDLVLDIKGNIALANNPYAVSQDVASAVRLFDNELWYQPSRGIPYFDRILGQLPPASLMKSYMIDQALSVPSVTTAQVIFNNLGQDRNLTGQITFSQKDGVIQNVIL